MSESLSAAASIRQLLARLTDNDLAELDQEITNLRQQLGSLQELRRLFQLRLHPPEPTTKTQRSSRAAPRSRTSTQEERRIQAAAYLLREGPQVPAHLADAIGVPHGGSLVALLESDWFERSGGKVELSSKGRMEYQRSRGGVS